MRLLEILPSEDRETLGHYMETETFPGGACIFKQGDEGQDCFLIDEGKIRLELKVAESDKDVILGYLEPGQLLGEFCLLEEGLRSASAFAEGDLVSRKLSRSQFTKLCQDHPALGITMMTLFNKELIRKTRKANEDLEEFLSKVMEHYPGLLFVTGADGIIGHHVSGKARELFGDVQGRDVATLLYQGNKESVDLFHSVLALSIPNKRLCESYMKDLTRSLICIQDTSYDLKYYVTGTTGPRVDSMLLIGTDVTKQLKEKQRADLASNEARLITSVARDLQGFRAFYAESTTLMHSLIKGICHVDHASIDHLFRCSHTIKGTASSFSLYRVVEIAHDLEKWLADLRGLFHKGASHQVDQGEMKKIWKKVQDLSEILKDEYDRICDLFQLKGQMVRVGPEELREAMEKRLSPDETFQYLAMPMFDDFMNIMTEKILVRALDTLDGQGIKKDIKFFISVSRQKLSEEGQKLLEKIFSHLLRNAADHGIEESMERTSLGKTAHGNITLKQEEIGTGRFCLVCADDGGGIDPKAVENKAIQRGIIKENEARSTASIQELIFHPGFSTKETADTLSGYGVGLDAVRVFLSEVGGSIRVASKKLEGTTFTIEVPEKVIFFSGPKD